MERFIALLLFAGGLAGAAAFAHRAGAPADTSFAAPFVQPASNGGASSDVLRIAAVPAATGLRAPAPVVATRPLRLAAPVRQLVPPPPHVVQAAVSAHPAEAAPEPVAPVVAPPPTQAPTPAPPSAPVPAPAPSAPPTPPAEVPAAPPLVATPPATAHDKGNGKDRGKAKGRNKDDVQVTPVAETIAPVETVTTVTTVTVSTPELAPVPPTDDQHGRGHGDKDK